MIFPIGSEVLIASVVRIIVGGRAVGSVEINVIVIILGREGESGWQQELEIEMIISKEA